MASSRKKTVYVLGAGFSKPADAPLQSEIIGEIFKQRNIGDRRIEQALEGFKNFLINGLNLAPQSFSKFPLEDVFTPIDRCILDGISFRSYHKNDLIKLREQIDALIIHVMKAKLDRPNNLKGYVNTFSKYLVSLAEPRAKNIKHDIVSVISTNWDILLDNSVKSTIDNVATPYGVVDYCCYISSLDDDDEKIKPGLWALGKGGYNVKLLKLHGSMNWLQCPVCQRLYVAFFRKVAEYGGLGTRSCRHCEKLSDGKIHSRLLSNLVMPTFLKDLNNFQIKLIWQNAAVELAEAKRVVFIGHSLPHSDYELRQLLSRSVPHDAEIEAVVLEEVGEESRIRNDETIGRYRTFFGERKVIERRMGVERYVNELCGTSI